jgi:hypothetical protein
MLTFLPDNTARLAKMNELIGSRIFALGGQIGENALFVDDEGMFNSPNYQFYNGNIYPAPLCGNGIIVGPEIEFDDGREYTVKDVTLKLSEIEVTFLQRIAGEDS